uniref:LOW QUALITY PROTEIN: BCL-6 corepressor n=1 Tax=Gasterosteus aculeatus aculeatus TaxID=481459 RepID=UPI001A98B7CD|nr:LOW QUALITY PROTEIN: BCL-6 corepressor [Gasterosteus aculeatus aculeatus]
MVDARLTPLSAMGLDRGSLIHDGLRLHGGVVYPGIRALPADKSRETPAHTLTYNRDGLPELIYKPDGPLDSRKPTNGYLGLYKGTPPGLHKPLLLHGAEGLGLERRLGPGEKASELGLAGAGGSYLRLPWLSPYPEASMYPFMDTSKYAALNMYKASLLSQPNPYLAQHLAYPSLCASQGGNVNPAAAVSAAERLYYMPPYPPSPISSPLVAPPMRIPTVTVAPTPMVHCQDKGLAVASQFTQQLHQPSPHPQHHQAAMDRDRSPSRGSRPSRPPSRKGSSNNSNTTGTNSGNNNNSQPSDSSPHASSRLPQPPPPPALIDNSLDLQRPVARIGHPPTSSTSSISVSSSSAQSIPHPFSVSSMASEQPSPARSSSHKSRPRDGAPEHRNAGVERRPSRSPSKPNFERPAHQPQATKDSAEKPLDLSGRLLEFGLPPNGYPVKMDALGSGPRYGLPPSRELLKDKKLSLSPSSHPHSVVSSTSTKVPERPEMISTLHSSWVVPSPSPSRTQHTPGLPPSPRPNTDLGLSQAKGSSPSVIKHKGLERVLPQQRSSSCPRTGESNLNVSSTQHSSLVSNRAPSPKPNGEWVKHSPSQSEHQGHHREGTEKSSQTTKRGETTPELSSYKRPCLENGHTPGHLYLPQSDAYLNHSLAYANRYLHYPIPDGMALHSLPIAGKGPVYPHPVLLGSNSLYPTHLAAKHPLPYHNLAAGAGGEYLTYNSQEMAHPLMQTHSDKLAERGDATLKPRGQEKSRGIVEECVGHKDHSVGKENGKGSQIKSDREAGGQGHGGNQSKHPSSSGTSREKIVCIDLVHSDTDIESSPTVNKQPSAENISKVNQNECCHSNQNLTKTEYEPKHQHRLSHPYPIHSGHSPTLKSNHTERQPDTPFGKPKTLQDMGGPGAKSSTFPTSPGNFAQAEHSPEVRSPSPDPDDQDQSTLRCARTSGERSSGKDKRERDSRAPRVSQHCTDVVKEERTCEGETEKEDSIVDLGESQGEGDDDDDDDDDDYYEVDGLTSPKGSRRSSLAKRIANSSGYVGDRFKCVTTELYADSSKLSREQRALQMEVISREGSNISQPAANWERAMMRFSELELKEKEGGGVCVSASSAAAAGRELADGQRRERVLEHCQHTTRPGERGGSVFADEREQPVPEDDDDDEVRKLKVCIELKGLRLSKPAAGAASPDGPLIKQERAWALPRLAAPFQSQRDRKIRPGEPDAAAAHRAEINRKWGCEKLLNGKNEPSAEFISGNGNLSLAHPSHRNCKAEGLFACASVPLRLARLVWLPPPSKPLPPSVLAASLQEVVLYCLENRVCEVNHRDYAGYCALHEACARGWLTIVQHLLDYGADINCSAQDGTRPIHDAVENDHLDVVRVLLSYGADPTLATYSGRGLLKMTHSDGMERFLSDYFSDLQGRADDDPGLYWEFYGSAVCELSEEGGVYDILADAPGPEDEEEDDKREVFEFEFSDRPLLPCYNIQVSLSQGPRNWLLLSDVLRRMRMSGRGFRTAFPHMEVVTVAEAEFYRQASLSQLFSCPEELEGFHADSKDLLDLVEDSGELAALLGSTLECLDDRWDRRGDRLKDKIKAIHKVGSS